MNSLIGILWSEDWNGFNLSVVGEEGGFRPFVRELLESEGRMCKAIYATQEAAKRRCWGMARMACELKFEQTKERMRNPCDSVDTKDESLAAGSMVDSTSTDHLPEPPSSTGSIFRDFILFSERIKIARQAEELMAKHNILHQASGAFGVVRALNMIGALKRPTDPSEAGAVAPSLHADVRKSEVEAIAWKWMCRGVSPFDAYQFARYQVDHVTPTKGEPNERTS